MAKILGILAKRSPSHFHHLVPHGGESKSLRLDRSSRVLIAMVRYLEGTTLQLQFQYKMLAPSSSVAARNEQVKISALLSSSHASYRLSLPLCFSPSLSLSRLLPLYRFTSTALYRCIGNPQEGYRRLVCRFASSPKRRKVLAAVFAWLYAPTPDRNNSPARLRDKSLSLFLLYRLRHALWPAGTLLFIPISILILLFWSNSQSPV